MRLFKLFFLFFIGFSLVSFKPIENTKTSVYFESDKQQIQTLIRKAYEWIYTKKTEIDFDVVPNKKGDKYIGINLKAHNKVVEKLKNSGFFAQQFIDNYNKIGLKINDNLKTNKMEYLVNDLPPYGNDSDYWCDCQDNPEAFWKTLKINNLKVENNKATFYWTWTQWEQTPNYQVTVVKENGSWKIAALDGLNYKSFLGL
ncbi:DUF3828 domain-containing protein [Flavobacterium sp. ANB]|uniref:DUF3828 domain-containing protein n=1 Tax=unclassified Flavobacterium TaxID=196869 RepID=UPI0012B784AF|nr:MULTISPECIES: DUF3828 domain-containing protein [unclassified Flavobacterium]MBF4516276.1 DUF3828 domain-containing protein [Flavobacterium sp. ANB]MTD69827.1 DUF3828 domain-containing protein [Flavobacterium sp. LC2016-13]